MIDWTKPIEIVHDDDRGVVASRVLRFDGVHYLVFDKRYPLSPWEVLPSGVVPHTGHLVRNTPEQPLHTTPQPDNFTTESPIRAFTEWSVDGRYAIGKGFRPSMQHVTRYLDAMESNEGWRLVQILEASTASPSFLFRKKKG